MERTFDVRLPDSLQPEDLTTLNAMVGVVERLKAEAPPKGGS